MPQDLFHWKRTSLKSKALEYILIERMILYSSFHIYIKPLLLIKLKWIKFNKSVKHWSKKRFKASFLEPVVLDNNDMVQNLPAASPLYVWAAADQVYFTPTSKTVIWQSSVRFSQTILKIQNRRPLGLIQAGPCFQVCLEIWLFWKCVPVPESDILEIWWWAFYWSAHILLRSMTGAS